MLGVIYGECHKQAHYAECHYAECHNAECLFANSLVVPEAGFEPSMWGFWVKDSSSELPPLAQRPKIKTARHSLNDIAKKFYNIGFLS